MSNNVFFSVDGDDVGKLIEKGLLENNGIFLKETSLCIKLWLEKIENIVAKVGGTLIMAGGDMILSSISSDCINNVLHDLSELQKSYDFTCSAAAGRTMSEVYFALKLAKSRGKNHFVKFIGKDFQPVSESKII